MEPLSKSGLYQTPLDHESHVPCPKAFFFFYSDAMFRLRFSFADW